MKTKFKVVIIGAGSRAALVIYPSLGSIEDVEIAAICDINEQRLNQLADQYQVAKRYGSSVQDYQRMIEEIKPDAVFAIGQPNEFYDIWKWCLEKGCNLYIEKPMGITIHQARILAYLADKNNCITQVSFQRRVTPMIEKLREECLKKGPVVHALCKFYKHQIQPNLDARSHMADDCVHSIDTLRWICSGEVVGIESHVKRVQVPDINFISATLHFDNGSTGYLLNSWSTGKRFFGVEIHSPGIYAEAEHEGKGYLYADGNVQGIEYDAKEIAGSDEFYVFTGVQSLVKQFIDNCKVGTKPKNDFSDSLRTMEVAEKILAQALLNDL